MVGWIRSTCSVKSTGIEYCKVLMVCLPVASWVKREKFAPSMPLALLTGTSTDSQSPAGDNGVAESPLSLSHAFTTSTLC